MAREKQIKIPHSARGDYRHVQVKGPDGKIHKTLTRYKNPTCAVIEFSPSNHNKARTLAGIKVLTHDDITKGLVFTSLEERAQYVRNSRAKWPEIKFYPAEIVS